MSRANGWILFESCSIRELTLDFVSIYQVCEEDLLKKCKKSLTNDLGK